MFPIALDLTKIPVLLIGSGELPTRRRKQLEEAGATQLVDNMQDAAIVMVAGLPRDQAQTIVEQAHALGKLVNVEDINDLCDFYFTANVRRGDLVIAVSTSGASPTLARKVRDKIAVIFGKEWAEYVSEMGALRKAWKAQGAGFQQLIDNTERHLKDKGWLTDEDRAA